MRNFEKSVLDFQWLEKGDASDRRKKAIHYKSFCVGDLKIELFDFVLVRNDDSLDPEDWTDCFIAQVIDLFDTGKEPEPHQAKVQWFSRVHELPQYSLKLLNNVDHQFEIIEDRRSNWSDIIDTETIFQKCVVLFLTEDEDFQPFISEHKANQCPVFFCRYYFTGTKFFSKKENPSLSCSLHIHKHSPKSVRKIAQPVSERRKLRNSEVLSKGKSSKNKNLYSATVVGSPALPKVLIRKLDDRILGYCNENVKIIVKEHKRLPVDEMAESFKRKLSLKTENDVFVKDDMKSILKRPIIHTLTSVQTTIDTKMSCNSEKRITDSSVPLDSILNFRSEVVSKSKLKQSQNNNTYNKKMALKEQSLNKKTASKQIIRDQSSMLTPSPTKRLKTLKNNSYIHETTDFTLTRSGRKVKALNYCEDERPKAEISASSSKAVKTKRVLKFVCNEYSDSESSSVSYEEENDSDDSATSDCSLLDEKCTPRSTKKTPKIKSAIKGNNFELNIPDRKTPLKTPQNILEESRQRLHVSSVPKSLPCREDEYSDIYSFVKGCLCAHTGGCMYISGVPGTGKTATVHEVMRNLQPEEGIWDVPNFKFVEINGMWITDPYQCYVHIYKSLTGKTIASQQAAVLLEKRFTEPGPKKDAVVMLVDELDRLWTRKQTVMYNIFDWPTKKHSRLVVLAIANTMDLPERLMMSRISSRLGLTRKTFQPYTFKQLQEIIMSRIQELKVFDPDAVQLVSRKVAAVSGDARRALDICRYATEVVQMGKTSPKKLRKVLVGMEHVDIALQQMFSSPLVSAIRASSNMAKLFFKGILSEFTRTGTEETVLSKVYNHIVSNCRFEGLHPPSFAEISNISAHLAASHLILIDNFHNDLYMKIRLNVSSDDVSYALTGR